jgi:hypothetical protein
MHDPVPEADAALLVPEQKPTWELPVDAAELADLQALHAVGWGEGDHQDAGLPADAWDEAQP